MPVCRRKSADADSAVAEAACMHTYIPWVHVLAAVDDNVELLLVGRFERLSASEHDLEERFLEEGERCR